MRQYPLKHQVIGLCVTLIVVTSASILSSFWWFSHSYKEKNIDSAIDSAAKVLERYVSEKQQLLSTSLAILTADYGFKTAVATNDKLTISSALDNLGQRINADLMIITGTKGQLIAASPKTFNALADLIYAQEVLIENPGKARFVVLDKTLYQLILQPVKAPRTVAYTVAGFIIDSKTVSEIKALTGVDISFYSSTNEVFATTFKQPQTQALSEVLISHYSNGLFFNRPTYRNRPIPMLLAGSSDIQGVISADLRPSHAQFDQLISTVIWLTAFILVLGFLASIWFGNRLTIPLAHLVKTANRFAAGDYSSHSISSQANFEVHALSLALNDMGVEIRQREHQIAFNARHDPLTRLLNRNAFLNGIEQAIEKQKPFIVIAYNLRGFRNINDSLGPQIGDTCLQAVAERVNKFPFPNLALHARLGGDEFIALLELGKEYSAQATIEIFNNWIAKPIEVNDLTLSFAYSLGTCTYPQHANDAKSMMRRAIIALEEGRREKVAIRSYKNGEDEEHLERLKIIDQLKVALNQEDQLFMVYQPKLNLENGNIEKVESLIRWQKPDGKWVSPEVFIGLAEQAGLIIEVTQWVVKTVITQMRAWQDQKIFTKVSINISAQDILHPDFIYSIIKHLEANKLSPQSITLEITERDLMENEQEGAQRLHALKDAGFELAVDDYGIGQSSLGKLKKLPVDELKIDKSFILKLDQSEADQVIVQSTIQLGHNLGLHVVAEGVENQATQDILHRMGCDHIQGFYFCRPITSNEFISWLKNYEDSRKPN